MTPVSFIDRHIGPDETARKAMLKDLGLNSLEQLIQATIPATILKETFLDWEASDSENELLIQLRAIAAENKPVHSYIGMGYYETIVPGVIRRNILENPGWYTAYTPYQAEISQGRLEALLNFQTMISDLTGMAVANASLLDEATAAAEAMIMLYRAQKGKPVRRFFVAADIFPQTVSVLKTRAVPLGIELVSGDSPVGIYDEQFFGCLLQYPTASGRILDYSATCRQVHERNGFVVVAADILSLALLTPPAEFGADVVVGSTQRLGVPMGYGGPHAAYFATTEDFKRKIPGRIIGVSVDRHGNPALRMALQTREQHIRREKATSNICTAQVLLAIMAGMYAVYHGPAGLRKIAGKIHRHAVALTAGLATAGYRVLNQNYFDTVRVSGGDLPVAEIQKRALVADINFHYYQDGTIGISLGETINESRLQNIFRVFGITESASACLMDAGSSIPESLQRKSPYLTHPVFNSYHSETAMLRYLHRLESRDLSLNSSMIPLGSCTMKLNATSEMEPLSWPEFANLHPFAPADQAAGYTRIIGELGNWLGAITGLPAFTMQPNSGAQGEYTGLMVIRAFHQSRGEGHRKICLIPASAHGTNPASAVMAGMEVVIVGCDLKGNIDLKDLEAKAAVYAKDLAAFMITYPSTHGVFEGGIETACRLIHQNGGQVYMDGANLNAMVGLCRPGDFGVDVIHINLHKTFAIPHGGGGPGMGPVCVAEHLAEYLPGHPLQQKEGSESRTAVAAAPWGSASILLISWAYMALMGGRGLRRASEVAILNANYMAGRISKYFPILYTGQSGRVAHEFIVDLRPFKKITGITEEDVAKRLMDYGFHAPTMSFPVPGTLMIEPTESEPRAELDRFCDAMIAIHGELQSIADGISDAQDNPLKGAPHTVREVTADQWDHSYTRGEAAFPAPELLESKFWPTVGRIDNAYGDRNLLCTCPPIGDYQE